ncbi:DUF1801 domain-containing protein [Longispora albida]|uniref:DUF1801 domain-containing protein n=1 Tax=Longispora albida TaxID=203523 RepID=UPI00036CF953|nr:DUF1801 domain-containing protein [Longispora albida]
MTAQSIIDYIDGLPEDLREIGHRILPVIEAVMPEQTGAVWHGHPVWSLGSKPGQQPVCLIKGYTSYLTFGFWRGQEVADDSGLLVPAARQMATIKLKSASDIDTALFTRWLESAVALEKVNG